MRLTAAAKRRSSAYQGALRSRRWSDWAGFRVDSVADARRRHSRKESTARRRITGCVASVLVLVVPSSRVLPLALRRRSSASRSTTPLSKSSFGGVRGRGDDQRARTHHCPDLRGRRYRRGRGRNDQHSGLTATADGRVFRFRDVGADVTRIEPDGTAVLLISGQVPFDFAGVLKIDLETGEAILEPRDRSGTARPRMRGADRRIAAASVARNPEYPARRPAGACPSCAIALRQKQ